MNWFQGSITEAVSASKSRKAFFVVFVEGNDEISTKFSQVIDAPEVSSLLNTEKFVSIKLDSTSQNYILFAKIYHFVPVPSLFFIANGIPVEILTNPDITVEELTKKVDFISKSNVGSATLSNQEAKINVNAVSGPSTSTEFSINNQPSHNIIESQARNTSETSNSDHLEDKVKRAKELVELKRQQREEEEKKKEKEMELQRRKTGRDVQKMKQQQHEIELKAALEEKQKESAANAAAKEKILQQIEEDKLERKKKHEKYIEQQRAAQQKKIEQAAKKTDVFSSNDMSKTKIQFRLPTGNTMVSTFEATETLSILRTYVIQSGEVSFSNFTMSAFFPRRDFSKADESKTLAELELVPSAVVLILPIKSNTSSIIKSSDGQGIFSHFIWTLMAPVFSAYNYIMSYFTGRNPSSQSNQRQNPADAPTKTSSILGNFSGGLTKSNAPKPSSTKIRQRGNVHTLHSGDNDDDENNTWNGNSTQQM